MLFAALIFKNLVIIKDTQKNTCIRGNNSSSLYIDEKYCETRNKYE